jgi:hypothetical protein
MPDPISAGIAAVATIGGGMMSSSAAASAASTQADAANRASDLQAQSTRESLDFQREMYGQQRADIAPYRQAGLTAQNRLLTLLGLAPTADTMAAPTTFDEAGYNRAVDAYYAQQQAGAGGAGGGTFTPGYFQDSGQESGGDVYIQPTFVPGPAGVAGAGGGMAMPTREQFTTTMPVDQLRVDQASPDFGRYARDFSMQDFEQDPGYAFRMSEGLKALDRQAAARGGLISGSALKGAQRFGQALGSQEYGSAFDRYQINRANQLNPLMSITGYGQTSTNTLGGYGSNLASNAANTMAAGSAAQANALGAAGQARASGYVGQANALNAALGNLTNIGGQYLAGRPSSNFLGGTSSMGTAVPTSYGPTTSPYGSSGGLHN